MSYISQYIHGLKSKPGLIVFDLDETLWPFDQYEGFRQPYQKIPNGWIIDRRGERMQPYPECDRVLLEIHSAGIKMAAASRTMSPQGAESLIDLLGWRQYFSFLELYPGTKLDHFKQLKIDSGINYNQMLFFDNEMENIDQVSRLGVTCVHVNARVGMTIELLVTGLDKYQHKQIF